MPRKTTPKSLHTKEHPPEFSISFQPHYRKGGEIRRMLENMLGPDVFKQGMELYLSLDSKNKPSGSLHHGYMIVRRLPQDDTRPFGAQNQHYGYVKNFINCMSQVSGKNLSQFLHWFDHQYTPTLDVTDKFDPDTNTYTLQFQQHSCENMLRNFDKTPMVIPVKMGLINERDNSPLSFSLGDSKEEQNETVLIVDKRTQEFHFKSAGFAGKKPTPSLLRDFSAPVKLNNSTGNNIPEKVYQSRTMLTELGTSVNFWEPAVSKTAYKSRTAPPTWGTRVNFWGSVKTIEKLDSVLESDVGYSP